jgi:hypothetical protein
VRGTWALGQVWQDCHGHEGAGHWNFFHVHRGKFLPGWAARGGFQGAGAPASAPEISRVVPNSRYSVKADDAGIHLWRPQSTTPCLQAPSPPGDPRIPARSGTGMVYLKCGKKRTYTRAQLAGAAQGPGRLPRLPISEGGGGEDQNPAGRVGRGTRKARPGQTGGRDPEDP